MSGFSIGKAPSTAWSAAQCGLRSRPPWMPSARARKGIHESMGMVTRGRHDQIPCCVSGMRRASGRSPWMPS